MYSLDEFPARERPGNFGRGLKRRTNVTKQRGPEQSLKSQSAWLLTAKVIGFALSFVLPLMIVRYLTQDSVGHYREAFQVITNAIVLLPLGFSMSAYYYLARETDRRGKAILNILLFNFVVGGIAFFTLFRRSSATSFAATK